MDRGSECFSSGTLDNRSGGDASFIRDLCFNLKGRSGVK